MFPRRANTSFTAPEVQLEELGGRKGSGRSSLFDRLRSISFESPADFNSTLHHGQTQTTFLGRKLSQPIVPAFIRKASLAESRFDKDPTHLRMGESMGGGGDYFEDVFFRARLHVDEASDEELDEKMGKTRTRKERGGWNNGLGWQQPSEKSLAKEAKKRESLKRKKQKAKRAMRDLDNNLSVFNQFAHNGLGTISEDSLPLLPEDDIPQSKRAVPVGDGFDALDVMADYIFTTGSQKKKWFKAPRIGSRKDRVGTGVSIRAKTGCYRTFPVGYAALDEFEEAVTKLNPEVAIKIKSDVVAAIMKSSINDFPEKTELVIDENTRIQILDAIPHLARARKHQYAAFIRDEEVLCVWADHVESVIPAAEALEEALIEYLWRGEGHKRISAEPVFEDEKDEWLEGGTVIQEGDPEDVVMRKLKQHWKERQVMLWAPISDGITIIVTMAIIALGLRTLVKEYALDGSAVRFALMVFALPLFCIASYACLCLVGSVFQTFGPIRQVNSKSKYYSGVAPKRTMGELAHVTVQMPVYKESLDDVIIPTVESLKKAITTYERQGGSVGILICDDGLQLLDQEEADRRRSYYFNNNISYVARPGHNVNGFIRKGRFKKAGNMNFAIGISLRVEEVMDELRPIVQQEREEGHFWNDDDESGVYEQALAQVLEEKEGIAWAAGNIRFGPIILIVDSDTRVPEDCFADAVSEMAESPEVAIIQHMSGVMQVANHFFENGVAFFTRSIQHAISFVCASGEIAPFVGHNAFIRWSALQECMHPDPDDGTMKIWSESHVSEDFQIAITLQTKGYDLRWATYSGGEFEEGVSLTCDDELNRWQKYSFGVSELIFHPFKHWFTKGPFTKLFRQLLWTPGIPLHSKYTVLSYIFSYYAIGCAWILSTANYFIMGLDLDVDGYYLPSWDVTLVCIILFVGICNIAYITLRYRLRIPGAGKMAVDQILWIPFFAIFFTGMSMPMSAALVSHLVGYNMTWSTTVKTVEKSNFFLQLPIIWKRFYPQLIFFTLMVALMIVTTSSIVPSGYRVHNIEVTFPMGLVTACHLLWPFALNPWFISFTF